MDTQIRNKIKQSIRNIEDHLIEHDFNDVGTVSSVEGLSPTALRKAIEARGGTLTRAPEDALDNMNYCCVDDGPPWSADVRLWIDGKPSDLHMILYIDKLMNGELTAFVDELFTEPVTY